MNPPPVCRHYRRAGDMCHDCGAVVRDGIGPLSTFGCRVNADVLPAPPLAIRPPGRIVCTVPAGEDPVAALVAEVARHRDIAERAVAECQRLRAGFAAMHRRAQRAEVCAARALREGLAACADLRRERDRALTSPTAAERREVYGLMEGADREYQALRREEAHARGERDEARAELRLVTAHAQRETSRLSAELARAWALVAAHEARHRAEAALGAARGGE